MRQTNAQVTRTIVLANVRALQQLARDLLDPEGDMSDEEFKDRFLAIIDNERFNEALDQMERQ